MKTAQLREPGSCNRNAKNTNKATKSTLKIFTDYLEEKGMPILPEILDADLSKILQNFYLDLRKIDGDMYKLQRLKCIRAGINRHLKNKLEIWI